MYIAHNGQKEEIWVWIWASNSMMVNYSTVWEKSSQVWLEVTTPRDREEDTQGRYRIFSSLSENYSVRWNLFFASMLMYSPHLQRTGSSAHANMMMLMTEWMAEWISVRLTVTAPLCLTLARISCCNMRTKWLKVSTTNPKSWSPATLQTFTHTVWIHIYRIQGRQAVGQMMDCQMFKRQKERTCGTTGVGSLILVVPTIHCIVY